MTTVTVKEGSNKIAWLFFVLLLCSIGYIWYQNNVSQKNATELAKLEQANAVLRHQDSIKSDSLDKDTRRINNLRVSEQKISDIAHWAATTHLNQSTRYKSTIDRQQTVIDSLSQAPCSEQLVATQSQNTTLKADNSEKDSTIEELGTETESYSRQLNQCDEQKANITDELASAKNLNKGYEHQFATSKCINTWTVKHPFLSWLFGIKCK